MVAPLMVLTIAVIVLMFFLFGPAVWKVWELAFFTDFDFGDPLTIAIVGVVVLIFMLRRR